MKNFQLVITYQQSSIRYQHKIQFQLYRIAILSRNLEFDNLGKKTGKTGNFEQKSLQNLEF